MSERGKGNGMNKKKKLNLCMFVLRVLKFLTMISSSPSFIDDPIEEED